MIIGLGTDLCDATRVEKTLDRFGQRFVDRLFADSEQRAVERRPQRRVSGYAMRFAAKEACAKALGTGFRQGVFWRDMVLGNEKSGKPFLTLHGGALKRLEDLTPDGMVAQINISLTDETPMAHAIVIISCVPIDGP
jgi:holo-[acyl-carrier protein] synthase